MFFFWGGAKDYVPTRTLRAWNQTHFQQGPRSSRVGSMLSRAIWALFLSILIKNIVDPIFFLGGTPVVPPPPPPPSWIRHCLLQLSACHFGQPPFLCDLKYLPKSDKRCLSWGNQASAYMYVAPCNFQPLDLHVVMWR